MESLELRWFVPGGVAEGELAEFGSGAVERRRDDYLLGTGPGLSVKRRGGGRLEQKRRLDQVVAELEVAGTTQRVAVERWSKRGLARSEHAGSWLSVVKRRARTRLGPCLVELTDLRVEHRGPAPSAWQTLAVETFGAGGGASTIVTAARELLIANTTLRERFLGAACMPYPAWLELMEAELSGGGSGARRSP